ncbi:MAG: ABC transporter substrate-binding protein [Acidobacteriota bacterium]
MKEKAARQRKWLLWATAISTATAVAWPSSGCRLDRPEGDTASANPQAARPAASQPRRIVSLSVGTDEILCALVPPERIAALSKYAAEPEVSYVAEKARRIGVFVEREPERLLALQADLVLLARYTKAELRQVLEQAGAPTLTVEDFRSLADVESNIRRIGRAVGEPERADAVIVEMQAKLAAARAALRPDRAGLRALCLMRPLMAAGRDTLADVKLTAAGLRNAAADLQGHVALSEEALLRLDPDLIFVATGLASDAGFREQLLGDRRLASLRAVREKRVLALPSRSLRTVSHHITEAVGDIVTAVNALP